MAQLRLRNGDTVRLSRSQVERIAKGILHIKVEGWQHIMHLDRLSCLGWGTEVSADTGQLFKKYNLLDDLKPGEGKNNSVRPLLNPEAQRVFKAMAIRHGNGHVKDLHDSPFA